MNVNYLGFRNKYSEEVGHNAVRYVRKPEGDDGWDVQHMGDAEYKDCVHMSLGNPVGKLPKATTWTPGKRFKDVSLRRTYCEDENKTEMAPSHIDIERRCLIIAVLTCRLRLSVRRT